MLKNMEKNERYCFLAFGELALDVIYDENAILKEVGGVSAFNALYNLSVFGEETYAVGGVGTDLNAVKAIISLKNNAVNTDYINFVNKPTNVFYIFKPQKNLEGEEVKIGRKSPITGKSTIEWSDKIATEFPREFENRNIILIVSNFENVTKEFIKNTKSKASNSVVSLDITNEHIFSKYSKEELWDYLKQVDLLQCNENTFKSVAKKLGISSPGELFSKLNLDIFTLTKGSKGANFYYRAGDKIKVISKAPEKVAPIVDSTGAGDAFHSMLLMCYHRHLLTGENIGPEYFDNTFKIANALSRKVVQFETARGEPYDLLKYMLNEIGAKEEKSEERDFE